MRTALLFLLCSWLAVVSATAAATPLDFALKDAAGRSVRAEAYRGQELLLVVFSNDCGSCRQVMPQVDFLADALRKGTTLLGIDYGSPAAQGKEAQGSPRPFPVLKGDGQLREQLQIAQVPTLYWVDGEGRLRERFIGRARVTQALALLQGAQRDGYRGLAELSSAPQRFVGTRIITSGVLREGRKKTFFQPATSLLTNGVETLELSVTPPALAGAFNRPLLVSGVVAAARGGGIALEDVRPVTEPEGGHK